MRRLTPLMILLAACASAPAPQDARPFTADPQPWPLPYAEVEAESGVTTGTVSGFSTTFGTAEAEASGRRFVTLAPGQTLTLSCPTASDSLVVRFSWPDGVADGRLEARWSGGTAVLPLTNRYSWDYGRGAWGSANVWRDPPSAGGGRHFWDEAATRTAAIAEGESVTFLNPNARPVKLDLVDFERVPEAVAPPNGSVDFSTWGADATGTRDVTELLQKAVDRARGGVLYLPEGTYRVGTVYVGAVTIQGAGLWRTRLVGPRSQLRFEGKTAHVADLAIWGETSVRDDTSDEENGLAGPPGPGSTVERVWVEHKKCAFWVGSWGTKNPVTGLTIRECRFRDLMADGVNLCSGTRDTLVEGCLVRNSGDDGLAAWSPKNGGPSGGGNTFRHNLVQVPRLASGIALYGGGPFVVEGNVVKDTVTTGSGLFVSSGFGSWPFTGTVTLQNNLLVRCGSHESDAGGTTGAIRLLASEGALDGAEYHLTNNLVVAPLESAVSIHGPKRVGRVVIEGLEVSDQGSADRLDVKRDADVEVLGD